MSKLICIDCDRTELRVVVGSSGLTGVAVDQCFSQSVTIPPSEEYFDSPILENALKALLNSHGVRSGNAIVTVPRNLVELRTLQVPTLDKNELPDMVRFAAQRHFASAGENWPIDFIALGNPTEGSTEVLAASINPARIERIQKLLESNGLKLQQLVLRPMVASAVALLKKPELKATPAIFVDRVGEEIDMAVVDGKHVVFMRSIRLANDLEPTQYSKSLVSEIKRTLLSAVSQNAGLKVSNIVLWGSSAEWAKVKPAIDEGLKLPTSTLDPFELVDSKAGSSLAKGNKHTDPNASTTEFSTGKFAAAIGGLLAPTYHQDLIDFAHPRKREEKKVPVLKYILAGTAAALLIGLPLFNHYTASSELSAEIARLNAAIAENKPLAEQADGKTKEWNRIQQFLNSNINWLDELRTISENVLPAEDVVFGNMTLSAKSAGQATITTKFETTQRDKATLLQDALRKSNFSVESKSLESKATLPGYNFSADLILQKSGHVAEDPTFWGKRVAKAPTEPTTTASSEDTLELKDAPEESTDSAPSTTAVDEPSGSAPNAATPATAPAETPAVPAESPQPATGEAPAAEVPVPAASAPPAAAEPPAASSSPADPLSKPEEPSNVGPKVEGAPESSASETNDGTPKSEVAPATSTPETNVTATEEAK